MSDLLPLLYNVVSREPGLTGRDYAAKLKPRLPAVTRQQVNQCLYGNAIFHSPAVQPPAWRTTGRLPVARPNRLPRPAHREIGSVVGSKFPRRPLAFIPVDSESTRGLCKWQTDAYAKWIASGRCGIVEAVTGAGKSWLGVAAVKEMVVARRRAVVIVPSVALMQQWHQLFRQHLPAIRIGILGGGNQRILDAQVTLAVVNTFIRHLTSFSDVELLVADEVHGYGSEKFSKALMSSIPFRLGLTATLERTDDAVEEVLKPYFGEVVYTCDFSIARRDGRLAPARIALLGVQFSSDEDEAYQAARSQKDSTKRKLIRNFAVDDSSIGVFLKEVQQLAIRANPARKLALCYLAARNSEAQVIANAAGKRLLVQQFNHLFKQDHSGLIFCERIAVAEEIARMLCRCGLRVEALTTSKSALAREDCLQKLRTGRLDAITTARVLDQGIDIPAIDTALIIASNQQKRQMIQRLGRVLRTKPDGRPARVVIAYTLGTWEDPAVNDHRAEFVRIAEQATEITHNFGGNWAASDVHDFLCGPKAVAA